MANTCRPVLAAPVRRLQPSTSFAAVTPRLRRDKLGVGKEPSRPQFATTFTAKAAHGSTLPRVLGRPRADSSTPSCARPSVRGSQPPLYLAIAGRDEAGEAIGGREPAAPRGDRAREKAWRPVHRFQREPEQSPGPQTDPAFARTGYGTASRVAVLCRHRGFEGSSGCPCSPIRPDLRGGARRPRS